MFHLFTHVANVMEPRMYIFLITISTMDNSDSKDPQVRKAGFRKITSGW